MTISVGAVSVKRTHEILSGVFNIPIATGTRVDKKLWWVHDASNCEFTYLDISPKRGYLGMEQCGVLPLFRGIAMHGCWASDWKYPDIQHAVCCVHLIRELTGIAENDPEQKWASVFIDLLLEMKKVKDKAIETGKESLGYYYYHKFDKRYDELIKQARKSPYGCPREKTWTEEKGKILALAERNIRMIKVKTKVSGCFRSEAGARDYLKIMSYGGTAHKQGHNAYDAIRNAISGCSDFIFE